MSENSAQSPRVTVGPTALLFVLAGVKILIWLFTSGRYGYFRDELYYFACADHLAWGYVDQPPFSIVVLALVRSVLGDSIHALRLLPALAGGAVVVLTGFMARELGAGRFGQCLAGLSVLIAPVYLASNGVYSMNAFDQLFWALGAYILVLILKRDDPKLWLWFGIVAGLGLQNKVSMAFFGFGVCVGLVLTRNWKFIADKWLWFGGAAAFLLFLPHLIWQFLNDWPTLEFMRNASLYKIMPTTLLEFFAGQLLQIHPLNFPIWFAGLCYYLFAKDGKPYRLLGVVYVAVFILLVFTNAKVYYLSPAYPMLLAAGALVVERFAQSPKRRVLKPAAITLLALGGIVFLPLVVPVLSPERLIAFGTAIGIEPPRQEISHVAELPQYFADRFGWRELAEEVARVCGSLSAEEREACVILTSNFGQAGALQFFGKPYDLPEVISPHNNYFLWGPGAASGELVITVGFAKEDLEAYFESVEEVGRTDCEFCMPYENNLPIYACRKPSRSLQEGWPALKHFD